MIDLIKDYTLTGLSTLLSHTTNETGITLDFLTTAYSLYDETDITGLQSSLTITSLVLVGLLIFGMFFFGLRFRNFFGFICMNFILMNIFNAVVSLVHEKTSTPKSVDYLHSYRPGYYYCKESTKLKEGDHITKDLIEVVQNKTRMMLQSDNIDQYLKENETSLVVKQLVMMFGALLLTTVIMIKTKSMIPVAISGSMAVGIRLFYELSFSDEPGKRLVIVALTLVIVSVICCFIDLAMNTLLLLMFAFTSSFTILLFTGVTANQVEFTNGLWFNILSYDQLMKQGIEFNYNKWLIILGILTMISIFFNIYTAKRTKKKTPLRK